MPKREVLGLPSIFALITWTCLFVPNVSQAQLAGPPLDYEPSERTSFSVFRLVRNLVLSRFVKDEMDLKRYIRDGRFLEIRRYYGDLVAVDAIYQKAVQLVDYNVRDALLIAFFATMDHRRVGVKIPLLGSIYLPLTAESDSLFTARWANLPSRFSGGGEFGGDRDKLQHFFGSAYIAYASRSPDVAAIAGSFVEWGESNFIVGGLSDWRDRQANERGRLFGMALEENPRVLPSDFLGTVMVEESTDVDQSQRVFDP